MDYFIGRRQKSVWVLMLREGKGKDWIYQESFTAVEYNSTVLLIFELALKYFVWIKVALVAFYFPQRWRLILVSKGIEMDWSFEYWRWLPRRISTTGGLDILLSLPQPSSSPFPDISIIKKLQLSASTLLLRTLYSPRLNPLAISLASSPCSHTHQTI